MIDKNDYEARFTSYLKHINGDGQTIKNILDVFNDMLERIKGLERANIQDICELQRKFDEYKKEIDADIERKAKIRFNNKVGQLRATIITAMKKYIDEELNNDL